MDGRELLALGWPMERLGEGMEALARHAGLRRDDGDALPAPPASVLSDGAALERWVDWAGARLGVEAEPVEATVPAFEDLLRSVAPAVLRIGPDAQPRFVLLLGRSGSTMRVLGPDLHVRRCPLRALRDAACHRYEAPLAPGIDRLLADAAIAPQRRLAARDALLAERLAAQRVGGCWLLRHAPQTDFWRLVTHARLPRRVVGMLALFALAYALEIVGWRLIGEAALDGRLDFGWLTAWLLLLLSLLPLRWLSEWMNAGFALDSARLLKQRLLSGALRMPLDAVRRLGVGQLLGRVMESQALEGLALNGGLAVLVALLELAFAAWILAHGAAPAMHLGLLALWFGLTALLSWRFFTALRSWTGLRLDMTNDLVERMVGHRTSLAQDRAARRAAEDDRSLQHYLQASTTMDRAVAPIAAAAPGGWILVALAGLGPAFVANGATPAALAISLGGILFAQRAFNGISGGLAALARAGLAWERVRDIFGAAAPVHHAEPFIDVQPERAAAEHGSKLVEASQVVFRYGPQAEPVLRGVDLSIRHGERILLEGPSGGGKSTLAALLVGLRRPDAGLLLLDGLDRHTLGESWHRKATEAPQFHENHIFTGTLGFNLLMGRNWPASDAELQEARELCSELELDDLIERMPAGLSQRIGETGWQLSHGERSRIFLARALLQKAPLTILDESFAALDPQTLRRCLDTVLRRAPTLVVIAHP